MNALKTSLAALCVGTAAFLIATLDCGRLYSQEENAGSNATAEFLTKATAAWENLRHEYDKGFTATAEYNDAENQRSGAVVVKYRDGMEVDLVWKNAGADLANEQNADSILGKNPLYSFSLKKDADKWSVSNVTRKTDTSKTEYSRFLEDLFGGIQFGELPLAELVQKPGFEILALNDADADGNNCVDMKFRFENPKDGGVEIMVGNILFDPNMSYVVKQIRMQGESADIGAAAVVDCAYQLIDDVPFVKEYKKQLELKGGADNITLLPFESLAVKDLKTNSNLPQKCFYLKYYGVPEPDYAKSGNNAKLAAIALGVILLAIGVYLQLRKKHAKN